MPHSFENPFIAKPSSLNPDQAEFLKKYASASEEQLQKAGLSRTSESLPQKPDETEYTGNLKAAASEEEKAAYLNEEVECGGVAIKMADAKKIQAILKKLNKQRQADGQPELTLGQEIKLDRMKIGGQSKKQLKKELEKAYIKTSGYANDLLNSEEFEPLKEAQDSVLVWLTVSDLGFPNGATTEEIYQRADELGLDLCPPETGPQLRVKEDTEQKFGEYFNIAMKQITDSRGGPNVFCLDRRDRDPWLDVDSARPGGRWVADFPFVFRLRK